MDIPVAFASHPRFSEDHNNQIRKMNSLYRWIFRIKQSMKYNFASI